MPSLRLDDIGAASKRWEYWAPRWWQNVWPLHSRYLFGQWGPYPELTDLQLDTIARTVAAAQQQIWWCITPYWIERNGAPVPYHEKFPDQAIVVRKWAHNKNSTVQVAAHGLYHCVPGKHRPRWFGMNRQYHREAVPLLPEYAKRMLSSDLGVPVTRYIHPGEAPTDEVIFHDREFVLAWAATIARLKDALR